SVRSGSAFRAPEYGTTGASGGVVGPTTVTCAVSARSGLSSASPLAAAGDSSSRNSPRSSPWARPTALPAPLAWTRTQGTGRAGRRSSPRGGGGGGSAGARRSARCRVPGARGARRSGWAGARSRDPARRDAGDEVDDRRIGCGAGAVQADDASDVRDTQPVVPG